MPTPSPYFRGPDDAVQPLTDAERKKLRAELKTDRERDHFDRRVKAADSMCEVLDQKRRQLPHRKFDWDRDERTTREREARELYHITDGSCRAELRRLHTPTRTRSR